jgi:arsenite methyltransferase
LTIAFTQHIKLREWHGDTRCSSSCIRGSSSARLRAARDRTRRATSTLARPATRIRPVAHPPGHGHGAGHFANPDDAAKRFDDPARDEWQKPDEVVRALQLTPSSVVADVGAGTGYFAMRLARVVPRGLVIATDIEPAMVKYIDERARREKLSNVRGVLATSAASGLATASVDAILVVHVWHHLADRAAYARDLATSLRPGGRVLIVDFRLDARRGPPAAMRLAPDAVVADLRAAGLDAKVSSVELPDQYIVEAHAPR